MFSKDKLSKTLYPIKDELITKLKDNWFAKEQKHISHNAFLEKAQHWFKSTKLNQIEGWDAFPNVHIILLWENSLRK